MYARAELARTNCGSSTDRRMSSDQAADDRRPNNNRSITEERPERRWMLWVEIPVRAAIFFKTQRAYRTAGAWGGHRPGPAEEPFLAWGLREIDKFHEH